MNLTPNKTCLKKTGLLSQLLNSSLSLSHAQNNNNKHRPTIIIIAVILSFGIALVLRLSELPMWSDPYYSIGAEHLLATHDAYHWIAGADGFEFGVGHPMSLLVQFGAWLSQLPTAELAFWLVPVLGSLTAVAVALWGVQLGFPFAGISAGVMCSLSPGFLGRTTLGAYDTDLITLLFALILALVPASWLKKEVVSPASIIATLVTERKFKYPKLQQNINHHSNTTWCIVLYITGLFGFWSQDWHSLFPYLTRFFALFTLFFILLLSPIGRRNLLLYQVLIFVFPMLNYPYGSILGLLILIHIIFINQAQHSKILKNNNIIKFFTNILKAPTKKILTLQIILNVILWGLVLLFCLSGDLWQNLQASVMSYLKLSVEATKNINPENIPFPAVAQSIIEIHDIKLSELFIYLHPWSWLAGFGIFSFLILLIFYPSLAYLLPLMAISVSSLKLGGRMGMFGAPIASLGVFIFLASLIHLSVSYFNIKLNSALKLTCAVIFGVLLSLPIVNKIPAMSLGPSISKETAEALQYIEKNTEKDSFVWIWWDWGYAAHHFAKRYTIADGARHGGPSLYLPALVYTTEDPYLASQVIKYTAKQGNAAGKVFENHNPASIKKLFADLAKQEPIISEGTQYLVVNFDLLPISLWISYFGSWDFENKKGKDYLINNLDKNITYNFNSGIVVQQELRPVYAASIDIFDSKGLQRKNYFKMTERHFMFNKRTQEKIVVDEELYKTLMVQLLLCEPNDPRFTPYFKLVFDNVMTRVYAVK